MKPCRPRIDLARGERRRRIRWVQIDELDLRPIDLVLFQRCDQQEFAESRPVHHDRFAHKVLDPVNARVELDLDDDEPRVRSLKTID